VDRESSETLRRKRVDLHFVLARRPKSMKRGVGKQHRAEWVVVRIEWTEPLEVGLRNGISENHTPVARDKEWFGSVVCGMRN
jgi:hypothetical protein